MKQADIAIRLHDSSADALEHAVREVFPDIEVSRGPLETARPERILVTFRPPEDEDLSTYTWVHSTGAGVDAICRALGRLETMPLITRTTGRMGQQIGEYCAGYALAHLQKMALRRELQTQRRWDKQQAAPRYLFETRIGVIGTGEIGQGIARAFSALGAQVTGYSRSGRAVDGFVETAKLDGFADAPPPDILVSALPLTDATAGCVNDKVFSALASALFINVGRGATLHETALKRALCSGAVDHAVLDVVAEEPLPEASWMWDDEGVTITPHVSGLTRDEDACARLVELLGQALAGQRPTSSVDAGRGY